MAFADRVIHLLNAGEEGVKVGREGMDGAPEGEVTVGPQELMNLAVADGRIEPVPGGCRVDEIEAFWLAIPGLERSDMDLDRQSGQLPASARRELRSQLDAHDRVSALQQRPCRFPGRTPDLQQPIARPEFG